MLELDYGMPEKVHFYSLVVHARTENTMDSPHNFQSKSHDVFNYLLRNSISCKHERITPQDNVRIKAPRHISLKFYTDHV